jgi:signal transduction histidine kinase
VVKHAAATEVRIEFDLAEEKLELLVADNGRGFEACEMLDPCFANPDAHERGNGLANMEQRLAEIGGTCEIESKLGQGTKVTFTVPLRR